MNFPGTTASFLMLPQTIVYQYDLTTKIYRVKALELGGKYKA